MWHSRMPLHSSKMKAISCFILAILPAIIIMVFIYHFGEPPQGWPIVGGLIWAIYWKAYFNRQAYGKDWYRNVP